MTILLTLTAISLRLYVMCMCVYDYLVLNKGLLYTNEKQIESNRIHL